MSPDDLTSALVTVLDVAEVRGLVRLSGGASRETWAFDAVDEGGSVRQLILQRARRGSERPGMTMAVEGALLRAAAEHGVPVAPVVTCSADPGPLGAAYLIMERVEGETIARKILRDPEFAHARTVLTGQWGAALAALHRIPLAVAPDLPATDQVEQYRQVLDAFAEPHPAFELAFRWLEANRPPQTVTALVHGDFRLGNCIVGPDGLRAVIDWELAHHGDAMEDLGWLCVKAWRFGSPKPVGGVGEYRELFDAYEAASGIPVDPEVVRWWEVLGTVKWGIMCMMQAHAHLSGMSRSHELAAIGRRVCENEHDVLALLP